MTRWEYRWIRTRWAESGRNQEYIQTVEYEHVWAPDGDTEEPFSGSEGLNRLGAEGWELVSVGTASESYPTRLSPQQGTSYSSFGVYILAFKRPMDAP